MQKNPLNPKNNSEGYADPTAYNGTKPLIDAEAATMKSIGELVHIIKWMCDLSGFEIVGRIVLKDKNHRQNLSLTAFQGLVGGSCDASVTQV